MKIIFLIFLISSVVFFTSESEAQAWIEVDFEVPDPDTTNNVIRNKTFEVNATVFCRGIGVCGNVEGTLLYNATSNDPDTQLNTTQGDVPFFVNETPSEALKSCITNPLIPDEFCNVTWTVNATGNESSNWKIGVLFNTTQIGIDDNQTNTSMSITGCSVDFTVNWNDLDFGNVNPNSVNNSALGNSENEYNVTSNEGSCDTDFYINSTDLRNVTFGNVSSRNLTWSNVSSNPEDGFYELTQNSEPFGIEVSENENATLYFWLNSPPTFAGIYNASIWILGVVSGGPSP